MKYEYILGTLYVILFGIGAIIASILGNSFINDIQAETPCPPSTPVYEVIPMPTPVLVQCKQVFRDEDGRYWCWPEEKDE